MTTTTSSSTLVIQRINSAKFFRSNYVTTGQRQVGEDLLNDYCSQIEQAATKEAIIDYFKSNKNELKSLFYELNDIVTINAFADFVINEYASTFSFDDGGNVSYSLSAFF